MTVASVLARIKEFETVSDQLQNCVTELVAMSGEKRKQIENECGVTVDLLTRAAQLLDTTAYDFNEDLNNCEVDCKCW